MTHVSPTDVPYRRRVTPLGSFGRFLVGLLVAFVFAFAYLRFTYLAIHRSISNPPEHMYFLINYPEAILELIAERMYADGPLVTEFGEFLADYALTTFVAVPVLVCGLVTVALVVRHRNLSIGINRIGE